MPIDASIPLQAQQVNPMQTLSSITGVANTMQGMQARAMQMQGMKNANVQSGMDAQERQAVAPYLADSGNYADERGNVDFNKFVPAIMKLAPTTGLGIIEKASLAMQQKAATQNAITKQSSDALNKAADAIYSLPNDATSDEIAKTRDAVASQFNDQNSISASNSVFNNLINVKQAPQSTPDHFALAKQHAAMMYQPMTQQQTMATPEGVAVDNGQQASVISTKPGTTVAQGQAIPGTAVQKQLPPTTPIMSGNTPGYLGPQGGQQSSGSNFPSISPSQQNGADATRLQILNQELSTEKDPANKAALQREIDSTQQGMAQRSNQQATPRGFVASGLPVGATQNIGNNIDEMSRHFGSLQDSASGNQLVQSLTGNIQSLAQKAITGTESDKLAYANGLLAALPGHGHADDLKTANDLLEKNMAQLNLSTPASSDAARNLISAARPHSSMTSEAIKEAASQLSAQVQANTAIRNHLSGYKFANGGQGDAASYQQERQHIENLADPRAWQYMNLEPGTPEAKKFISNLSDKDRNQLGSKIRQLEKMGMIQ